MPVLGHEKHVRLDPAAEFQQVFAEGWRNQRDYFYVPNLHGADWPKLRQMYGAFLPHVGSRETIRLAIVGCGGRGGGAVADAARPDRSYRTSRLLSLETA